MAEVGLSAGFLCRQHLRKCLPSDDNVSGNCGVSSPLAILNRASCTCIDGQDRLQKTEGARFIHNKNNKKMQQASRFMVEHTYNNVLTFACSLQGGLPVSISITVQPKLQISEARHVCVLPEIMTYRQEEHCISSITSKACMYIPFMSQLAS